MGEPSGWSIFEDAARPTCCLDDRLRYRRVNAAWEAWAREQQAGAEHRSSASEGRPFLDDVEPSSREQWEGALGRIMGAQLGHYADEVVAATPAGERRVVRTASPTFGADGRPDGVLLVLYDVTDAAMAARAAERHALVLQAARRLQHFLGNQLALTMGYVELMTIDPRLPAELRERVDEALRGVVEATETLNYLRRLAREQIAPDDPSLEEYLRGEHG